MIPTSNHNKRPGKVEYRTLFISWFLHQTTTTEDLDNQIVCCLSLDSYIKPQPWYVVGGSNIGCLSLDSYIKPQPRHAPSPVAVCCLSLDSYIKPQRTTLCVGCFAVVYLLIPTSNHNVEVEIHLAPMLFISWFLHQTTTIAGPIAAAVVLFISWFLHQTTTRYHDMTGKAQLFISWFLHQTTTQRPWCPPPDRCLSLDSYIKPQLKGGQPYHPWVVYLLIPTSNHNFRLIMDGVTRLFISWFLHQTTTLPSRTCL